MKSFTAAILIGVACSTCTVFSAEDLEKPYLGALLLDTVDAEEVAKGMFPKASFTVPKIGAFVFAIDRFGSAGVAGLTAGDVIYSANGKTIANMQAMLDFIKTTKPGESVQLKYQRPKFNGVRASWSLSSSNMKVLDRETAAITSLRKEVDEVRGITFYHNQDAPKKVTEGTLVYPYISKKPGEKPALFLRFQIVRDDPIFLNGMIIKSGDITHAIKPTSLLEVHSDFENDVQWYDHLIGNEELPIVESVVNGGILPTFRFDGSDSYVDYKMLPDRHFQFNSVVTAFRSMLDE